MVRTVEIIPNSRYVPPWCGCVCVCVCESVLHGYLGRGWSGRRASRPKHRPQSKLSKWSMSRVIDYLCKLVVIDVSVTIPTTTKSLQSTLKPLPWKRSHRNDQKLNNIEFPCNKSRSSEASCFHKLTYPIEITHFPKHCFLAKIHACMGSVFVLTNSFLPLPPIVSQVFVNELFFFEWEPTNQPRQRRTEIRQAETDANRDFWGLRLVRTWSGYGCMVWRNISNKVKRQWWNEWVTA